MDGAAFAARWKAAVGQDTLRVRVADLRGRSLPEESLQFLLAGGLPLRAAPDLTFGAPGRTGFPVPSRDWDSDHVLDRYIPLGEDGAGDPICLRSPDGRVVRLDRAAGLAEVEVAPSWEALCEGLLADVEGDAVTAVRPAFIQRSPDPVSRPVAEALAPAPSEADVAAPPQAAIELHQPAPSDALALRQAHVRHEGTVRAFGNLALLGAVGSALTGVVLVFAFLSADEVPDIGVAGTVIGLVLGGVMGLLSLWMFSIGRGLRRLDPGIKGSATICAALQCLSVPFGTLVGGGMLWAIHSEKGRRILSPEWAAVVAATPQIQPRTSPVAWAALAIVVLGCSGLFCGGVVGF